MSLSSHAGLGSALHVETRQEAEKANSQDEQAVGMVCSSCSDPHLRRVERRGFWQKVVLPKFGYYPWECSMCRDVTYLRFRTRPRKS